MAGEPGSSSKGGQDRSNGRPATGEAAEQVDRRRRQAEYRRAYRAEHAEEIAEYKRQWRKQNHERDLGRNREYMRRKAAEKRDLKERRASKAEYARERYHGDIETSRARARELAAQRRAADPEGQREAHRRRNQAWRESHKVAIAEKRRANHLTEPESKQVAARRYYEKHAEQRKEYSRRHYAEHHDELLAKQRDRRRRLRQRTDLGLPARRLHRSTPEERREHTRAADAFFTQQWTPDLVERLRAELRTPPELIAAWQRECARTRADQYAVLHPETRVHIVDRARAEEARMDAIAREINNRLRLTARAPITHRAPEPGARRDGLAI